MKVLSSLILFVLCFNVFAINSPGDLISKKLIEVRGDCNDVEVIGIGEISEARKITLVYEVVKTKFTAEGPHDVKSYFIKLLGPNAYSNVEILKPQVIEEEIIFGMSTNENDSSLKQCRRIKDIFEKQL